MYSTCLFCTSALGRNESIEHFPVGRRLAFDAAKGRLWVICPACNRWNLTPLESRWEAIEEAERAYRDTKLRRATEHIGLAQLKEGTELVRIGKPLLPEFAAWRYGEVFGKRLQRERVVMGASLTLSAAYCAYSLLGVSTSIGVSVPIMMSFQAANVIQAMSTFYRSSRVRSSVVDDDGQRLFLSSRHAAGSRLLMNEDDSEFGIALLHRRVAPAGVLLRAAGRTSRKTWFAELKTVEGAVARRALTAMLPIVNQAGANTKHVSGAVTVASETRSVLKMLTRIRYPKGGTTKSSGASEIGALPTEMRLALEMVTHEDDERRALDGELHELETRWKEAEEIAAIADRMFLPADVDERLDRWRRTRSSE